MGMLSRVMNRALSSGAITQEQYDAYKGKGIGFSLSRFKGMALANSPEAKELQRKKAADQRESYFTDAQAPEVEEDPMKKKRRASLFGNDGSTFGN